ncbi:hypothetical protein [Rugosimonospora acidiphila]|uniref:hypothetical protein n=1 Tax=Rugosimonospora acidiphila TaxID=556531 RepID=UPI0031ED8B41
MTGTEPTGTQPTGTEQTGADPTGTTTTDTTPTGTSMPMPSMPMPSTPMPSTPNTATPDASTPGTATAGTAKTRPAGEPRGAGAPGRAPRTAPRAAPGRALEPVPAGYAQLISRLAGAEVEHARRRTAVHEWFARQGANAQAEVARSAQRVAEAESVLASAQAAVEFTEAESARLWLILAGRMRLRDPARLGPAPGPDESGEPVTEHPAHLLDQVREMLDQVRPTKRGRGVVLPLMLLAALVVVAAIGIAAYLLAG